MKKAIQVNLNDQIYYIDEDAYNMLQNYLERLGTTFNDQDGQEIVNDIETRVGELFSERVKSGYNVIDISYVEKVIDMVGSPEEINGEANYQSTETGQCPPSQHGGKRIYRNTSDKVFGGVLSGIAAYFGWDVTILRLLVAIFAVCTTLIPCIFAYLIAWMVIPPADTPEKMLKMQGKPVTFSSISQTIKDSVTPPTYTGDENQSSGALQTIGTVLKICCKIILGMIGLGFAVVGLSTLIGLIFCITNIFGFLTIGVSGMADIFSFTPYPGLVSQLWFAIVVQVIVLLISIIVCWVTGTVIFNWKPMSKKIAISLAILIIILISISMLLLFGIVASGISLIPFVPFIP